MRKFADIGHNPQDKMALLSALLVLIIHLRSAVCWTYTEYLIVLPTSNLGFQTTPYTATVSPTGSVAPTSTSITTTQTEISVGTYYVELNVTVTNLYLSTDAPVCTPSDYQFRSCPSSATTKTSSSTIQTNVWAAVIISNPSTCTQTSFTYTTSSEASLVERSYSFPGIFDQATEMGSHGEALFVTTYISTISTDLGGQAVTTTRCDIWLKSDAFNYIPPASKEFSLLTQCVDPRRYLCRNIVNTVPSCGTDWVGTYPPITGAATNAATGSATGGATTTKTGGVTGLSGMFRDGLLLMTLTVAASIFVPLLK